MKLQAGTAPTRPKKQDKKNNYMESDDCGTNTDALESESNGTGSKPTSKRQVTNSAEAALRNGSLKQQS